MSRALVAIIAILMSGQARAEGDPTLRALRTSIDAAREERLLQLAREAVARTAQGLAMPDPGSDASPGACGVFVTLVGRRGVRGCYGDLNPGAGSLEDAVVQAAQGAASRDTRFLPVRPGESDRLTVIVSLTLSAEPVSDYRLVDPDRYGILVQAGSRSALLLPGEARTASWGVDESMRKAGIKAGEQITVYRFRTLTLVSGGVR